MSQDKDTTMTMAARGKRQRSNKLMSGIYLLTNLISGKKYVGASKDLDRRYKTHFDLFDSFKHGNKEMQYDFDNGEVFDFEILEYVPDIKDLGTIEQYYINWYSPDVYNVPSAAPYGYKKARNGTLVKLSWCP